MSLPFANDDAKLLRDVEQARADRAHWKLDGLVGGLEAVVVNVDHQRLRLAVEEFLNTTGYVFDSAHEEMGRRTCVLRHEGSADFLFTERVGQENPFREYNVGPKTEHLPDSRLETLIFKCPQLEEFVDIQRRRGVRFLTDEIVETDKYLFIQTEPSPHTGNSIGYIKWLDGEGEYLWEGAAPLHWRFAKPDKPHLTRIFELDHMATRVRADERDAAICEFMLLTGYDFKFSVYVESLNSITNVARLSDEDFAMVFTSGIKPFESLENSGPTEAFIENYGLRVHHMAFRTEDIENTFAALKADGMEFLVELVGGVDEGLHQTFSKPSPNTFLVNEYIKRYGGFTGFFTKSNVTTLTRATEGQ